MTCPQCAFENPPAMVFYGRRARIEKVEIGGVAVIVGRDEFEIPSRA